ncbi:MAG: polyphenol oxidase family protein [Halobacteriovoraceae bacterium]|nr:polyphenol oxidase family protein [Halobacteriovoraceae bacterium]MCB9095782.1 polyphenol oxidase family protein [Halobacteriovoraceae bacterium]
MEILYKKSLDHGDYSVTKEKSDLFLHTKQVHGNKIVTVDEIKNSKELLEADGILATWDTLKAEDLLCVFTADCLPVVIEGSQGVAILHAGWRGVHKKIHLNSLIDKIHPQKVVIGPSIQCSSFQVTEEFTENFPNSKFFSKENGKLYFNLQAQVKEDLENKYHPSVIYDDGLCTFKNNEYNSYRRDKKINRNYNIYQIRIDS